MRIGELSRASDVPVPTIKFYLREGLLPDGRRTSPNQAQYDDGHVQRLRLIRALVGVGGLSLAATRDVLQRIDEPKELDLELLGAAHQVVGPELPQEVELGPAIELLQRWGWTACAGAMGTGDAGRVDDAIAALAVALEAIQHSGFEISDSIFETYAEAMMTVARAEIDGVPTDSPARAVRYVVLGTVLVEPVLLALRRLAQREASASRFSPAP